jgi:outer membrane protein assembly factor BamE (lipoprotein component of BamABCDE complex)
MSRAEVDRCSPGEICTRFGRRRALVERRAARAGGTPLADARAFPVTNPRETMKRIQLLSIVLAATLLPACIINANSHTTRSGKYISTETIQRVEAGKDAEYVLAVLGDPSSKQVLSDGTEIWKWSYRERRNSSGGVFLLVSSDKTTETERSTYVEMKDGKVARAWQD